MRGRSAGGRLMDSEAGTAGDGDQKFALLDTAAARLLRITNPGQLIDELFELASQALGLDVYFHYGLESDGLLHLAKSSGLDEALRREGACLALGAAVCGCVARDRVSRHVADVHLSEDPDVDFIRRAGLKHYACHPLIGGDQLLGTLGFGRRDDRPFTADERLVLQTLTRYVAIAKERLRVEAALGESERRLNAVLNNATVAIFVMDERQHCSFMNAAAERLTGFAFEEVQGRALHDVIHHTRPDGSHFPIEECAIDRAFPENNQQQGEEVFVHRDGSFYPVAFTASPIRDEASHTVGTIIEVRDIAHQKRNEEARELLMREVDHRARNALTVVQSMLRLTRASSIEHFQEILLGRVSALARAQGALAAQRWEGGLAREVIEGELATVGRPSQYRLEGDDWPLAPQEVQPLGMIVHELATNAAKYGALSAEDGCVTVRLSGARGARRLAWIETGGPAAPPPPRQGFGSRLIGQLAAQLNASLARDWGEAGLTVTLDLGPV
ncbi:sensor histidine kinase [Caulobacter segnis]|uniref:histidine kinase n=1 Tax=Caulobacter segnis TaxID=88688 RepID=A0A2W5WCK5_9CAUL|nr:PAS domain S-box protein [Caulobacter segnis]PZR31308.1 MAG: hypothetical protein DI526_20100 [Caulobacter segnis]